MLVADSGDRQRSRSFASASDATGASVQAATPTSTTAQPPSKLPKTDNDTPTSATSAEPLKDSSSLVPACWEPNWDTSVYKRKKNCKKRRDPMEPQKPVSAYALFFRDTQAAIKSRNPKASFGDISKTVASMWDTLDGDTKNQYKKRTDMAKKEYLKRLAAYRARLISTVGLHHSWQTAGFCGQPSYALSQSDGSNGTVCATPTARTGQTDYRTPTALSSYGMFDNYAQRYGNNNYYSLANQNGEQVEASYQSAKLDAARLACQPFEGGASAVASCAAVQVPSYTFAKMPLPSDNSGHVSGNSFPQRTDYTARMDSGAVYGQDCVATQGYAHASRTATGYDARATGTQPAFYSASYYRPAQNVVYCAADGSKVPYASNVYHSYWAPQPTATLAPLAVNDVHAQPSGSTHYSASSASSSSSSSSDDSTSGLRSEPLAPDVAHAPPVPAHAPPERSGTFDYWANAIGYY